MSIPVHGGDLTVAMAAASTLGLDAGAPEDWLDLSTGINPRPYPILGLLDNDWHRLPDSTALNALKDAATRYYNAPSSDHIIAASGTALLIQLLPLLFDNQQVSLVAPTYGDHEKAWRNAGFTVNSIAQASKHQTGGILVVVNPNNPDGHLTRFAELEDLAKTQTKADGWLIVDEAFGDLSKEHSAVSLTKDYNVIVLKSIGKFFGLAGMRLGFAVSRPKIINALTRQLGSWAVSGPAISLGTRALNDQDWIEQTRLWLCDQTQALHEVLASSTISIVGHTDLFTLITMDNHPKLYNTLLKHKIYTRQFDYASNWLRLGLPKDEHELHRLKCALEESAALS